MMVAFKKLNVGEWAWKEEEVVNKRGVRLRDAANGMTPDMTIKWCGFKLVREGLTSKMVTVDHGKTVSLYFGNDGAADERDLPYGWLRSPDYRQHDAELMTMVRKFEDLALDGARGGLVRRRIEWEDE